MEIIAIIAILLVLLANKKDNALKNVNKSLNEIVRPSGIKFYINNTISKN